jgi:hypothetical protein
MPRRREVWAKMAAPASVVKRGVADESGNERAREQVEGEREGQQELLFVYAHRVNVGSRSRITGKVVSHILATRVLRVEKMLQTMAKCTQAGPVPFSTALTGWLSGSRPIPPNVASG